MDDKCNFTGKQWRRYRGSLDVAANAVEYFNAHELDFVLHNGDIIDHQCAFDFEADEFKPKEEARPGRCSCCPPRQTENGGQGECLVLPYTRGSASLSLTGSGGKPVASLYTRKRLTLPLSLSLRRATTQLNPAFLR